MDHDDRDGRGRCRPRGTEGETATRRAALAGAATAAAGLLAGCATLTDDGTPVPEETLYERLDRVAVYRGAGLELSFPDPVETVRAVTNADLLVLAADVDADADRAVEWLANGRVVALVGDNAQDTWLDWARADVFTDTFDNDGYGVAEPEPDLLVAARVGTRVDRYNRTWEDGPTPRQLRLTLDETLVDVAAETPR